MIAKEDNVRRRPEGFICHVETMQAYLTLPNKSKHESTCINLV